MYKDFIRTLALKRMRETKFFLINTFTSHEELSIFYCLSLLMCVMTVALVHVCGYIP